MKTIEKVLFLSAVLLLVGITLVSQTVVSVAQDATAVPALAPTPIGGSENGVIYQGGAQGSIVSFQKDLSDSSTIVPLLSQEQLEEALGKKLDHVDIYSISPDGKIVYMWVYEPNKRTPAPYLASVDLSFFDHLSNSQYVSGGPSDTAWSPDGSALMGMAGMSTVILERGKTQSKITSFQGNMLTWSRDGSEIYDDDGRNHLVVFNMKDGSKKQVSLPFLEAINHPHARYGADWERTASLAFSPVSDEILLVTGTVPTSHLTVYKTTADFTDASVLATFDLGICNIRRLSWSPNTQYVWLDARMDEGCDGRIFKATDGSVIWGRNLLFNDKDAYRGEVCGWSPDNHFVIYEHSEVTPTILSFWDPTQPSKPILSVPFSGSRCPIWLTAPAAS